MKIPKKISWEGNLNLLSKLANESRDVIMPSHTMSIEPGGLPSFIALVNAHKRLHPNARCHFSTTAPHSLSIASQMKSVAAQIVSLSSRRIIVDDVEKVKSKFLKSHENCFDNQIPEGTGEIVSRRVDLTCFDDTKSYSYHPNLYQRNGKVKNRDDFQSLLALILGRLKLPDSISTTISINFAALAHEAFLNTDDFAKDWKIISDPNSSYRVFSVSVHTPVNGVDRMGYLEDYLQKTKCNRFAEISISDVGPGIPNTLRRNQSYSGLTDQKALLKSLLIGVSSTNNPTRGFGLTRVINAIAKSQGFLQITSSETNLILDFSLYTPPDLNSDISYSELEKYLRFSEVEKYIGTTIIAIVPL